MESREDLYYLHEQEQRIMNLYEGHCALCYWRTADVIHHEPPRSLNPAWREEPWTWYPLCPMCHSWAHAAPRQDVQDRLRVIRMTYFPGLDAKFQRLAHE